MPESSAAAEISALELARALESGEPMQVVDVRAPERVRQARIDVASAGALPQHPRIRAEDVHLAVSDTD